MIDAMVRLRQQVNKTPYAETKGREGVKRHPSGARLNNDLRADQNTFIANLFGVHPDDVHENRGAEWQAIREAQ